MSYVNLGQVMYPVGSIFMSSKNISPSSIFGGTWSALTDQKMWLPSDSYNTIGGEWNHALSNGELPKISGSLQCRHTGAGNGFCVFPGAVPNDKSGPFTYKGYTGAKWGSRMATEGNSDSHLNAVIEFSIGNNQAHNNMPPYRTCFCWVRTA